MHQSFESEIWLIISFLPQRESHSTPNMDFLAIFTLVLSQFELSEIKLSKFIPSILIEKFDHSIFSGL